MVTKGKKGQKMESHPSRRFQRISQSMSTPKRQLWRTKGLKHYYSLSWFQCKLHFNQMNMSIVPVRIREAFDFHISPCEIKVLSPNSHRWKPIILREGSMHAELYYYSTYVYIQLKKTHLNVLYGLWTKWCFLACCIDDANYNCSSTHFWNKT